MDKIIKEYLLFMIGHKEIKGQSWKNRPANDFYRILRQDAERYNVSVLEVLKQQAYFVIKCEFISLIK